MDESDKIYYQKSNGKPSLSSSRLQLHPQLNSNTTNLLTKKFIKPPIITARSATATEWPFSKTVLFEAGEESNVIDSLYLTKTEKELLKLFDIVKTYS